MSTLPITFIPHLGMKLSLRRISRFMRRLLDRIIKSPDICPHCEGTDSAMCDYPGIREKHRGHHHCPKGKPCFLRADPRYQSELEAENERRINITRYGVPYEPDWAKRRHI